MKNINKALRVTMPDGSQWDVPIVFIAHDRAAHYAPEGGEDFEREFEEAFADLDEIQDWAANNMNWSDVSRYAKCIQPPSHAPLGSELVATSAASKNYQGGWVNGAKEIVFA